MGCGQSQAKQTTSPSQAPGKAEITLEYFGIMGRAEPLRMLLTHGKIPFNDKGYPFPDDGSWAKRKEEGIKSGKLQFGGMPIVSVKDKSMQ